VLGLLDAKNARRNSLLLMRNSDGYVTLGLTSKLLLFE